MNAKVKKELSPEHMASLKAGRDAAQAKRKADMVAKGLIQQAEAKGLIQQAEAKAEVKAEVKPVSAALAARRRKTHFGPRLKLGVEGSISGFKMKWVNDYNGELEESLSNGWKFVEHEEIDASNISFRGTDKDVGNRISRETALGAGVRIRCYLLKIENEVYDEIMDECEALAKDLESPVKNGTYGLGEHEYKGATRFSTN